MFATASSATWGSSGLTDLDSDAGCSITSASATHSTITTRRNYRQHLLELARKNAVIRARDAAQAGIPTVYLTRLVRSGELDRVGHGLYALSDSEPSEHVTLAEVSKVASKAVICLVSAAAYHGFTTQVPAAVWIALPAGTKAPTTSPAELSVVHEGPEAYGQGMSQIDVDGVRVRIYGPSKTVADLFKFRRRAGIDVALEALKEYWASDHRNAGELRNYLDIDHVSTVVEPYLELLAS